MLERSVLFPTVPVGSPPPPVSYRGYRYCTLSARVATGPRLQWPLAVGGRLSIQDIPRSHGVRGGSFRARCPDSGLVQTEHGDRARPSRSTDGSRYPRLVPSGSRLGLRQRLWGIQGGRRPPCSGCVVVSPASVALAWRPLSARSMLDARSFMISTLRSQVGFAAAVAHARLRLSRLELMFGGSGRTAGRRYASAARAFISPTAFEQARGGALGAGGGRVGFAGGGLF